MEKENATISKTTTLGWLQRLKDESWEAELLVSAIAIFGTFQLFDVISWVTNSFIDLLNPSQYFVGYFIVTFGLLAVSILVSMFVIHFFLRAYWIGLVGLNSVFPDYSLEDSAYSKIYTKKIISILPKLKTSIQKTDELCSVIFSAAFTFLLIYAYLAFFASIYLFIYNLLSEYVPSNVLLIPVFFLAFCLILQMLIIIISNLKPNKEKEGIQQFSFKVNKFVSMLIYGPLYKSILQVTMIFGSNFKKKKSLVYLIISFLIVGVLVFGYQVKNTNIFYLTLHKKYFNSTKVYPSFYKSENKENTFLLTPEINSDKIEANVLKVFIPVFKHEEKIREELCGKDKIDSDKALNLQREEYTKFILNCFQQYYHIYINDKKIDVSFLRYHKHSRTEQRGIISYIDISNLEEGLNIIEIKKQFNDNYVLNWKIPFYRLKTTD